MRSLSVLLRPALASTSTAAATKARPTGARAEPSTFVPGRNAVARTLAQLQTLTADRRLEKRLDGLLQELDRMATVAPEPNRPLVVGVRLLTTDPTTRRDVPLPLLTLRQIIDEGMTIEDRTDATGLAWLQWPAPPPDAERAALKYAVRVVASDGTQVATLEGTLGPHGDGHLLRLGAGAPLAPHIALGERWLAAIDAAKKARTEALSEIAAAVSERTAALRKPSERLDVPRRPDRVR
jgi:hypothetical protein